MPGILKATNKWKLAHRDVYRLGANDTLYEAAQAVCLLSLDYRAAAAFWHSIPSHAHV